MDNVLDEVESLFKKLHALPDDVRQAAINKIQEQLSPAKFEVSEGQGTDFPALVSSVSCLESPNIEEVPKPKRATLSTTPSNKEKKEVTKKRPRASNVVHVDVHPVLDPQDIGDNPVFRNERNVVVEITQFKEEQETLSPKQKAKKNLKKKNYHPCPKCDKCFKQSSNLKVHLKRHNGQKDYACNECGYRSVTKIDIERHVCTIHSSVKDLICEYCAKAFSLKRSLYLHIRTVHKKHTEKFYCNECLFMTHRKNNLKVHIRLKHLGDYYTHVCPVCDARVLLRSAFIEHVRAHTGDRPYVCEHCSASFACVGRLNTHRRTIHAPKQFSCRVCDKKFPTKYSVQRHETVHTNEKPHSCPFCSFACNMPGNLTKHVRKMHGKPDFSVKTFKKQLQGETDQKQRKKWSETGHKAFKQYLNNFSKKLGRKVTVQELKDVEEERKKQQVAAMEKARLERISKNAMREHSYVLKPLPSPNPTPNSPPPSIATNIYLEAMAAANLDFTSVESFPIPDFPRAFPEIKLLPVPLDPATDEFTTNYMLPDDKSLTDPLLSTYMMPSIGLEPLTPTMPCSSSMICAPSMACASPNLYVQLPSGEKVPLSLNMLRDAPLMDMGLNADPLSQVDGLLPLQPTDLLPSVMIVVSDPLEPMP